MHCTKSGVNISQKPFLLSFLLLPGFSLGYFGLLTKNSGGRVALRFAAHELKNDKEFVKCALSACERERVEVLAERPPCEIQLRLVQMLSRVFRFASSELLRS